MRRAFVVVLVILSALLALAGGDNLTQATLGVGLICGGCYLGIIARIVQAERRRD